MEQYDDGVEAVPERIEACFECPPSSSSSSAAYASEDSGALVAKMVSMDIHERYLVTGCEDGRMIVWDLERRGLACELRGEHTSAVRHVLWGDGGEYVVAAHDTGVVVCWNVGERTVLCQKDGFVGVRNLCRWGGWTGGVMRCIVSTVDGVQCVSVMHDIEEKAWGIRLVPFHEAAGLPEAWYLETHKQQQQKAGKGKEKPTEQGSIVKYLEVKETSGKSPSGATSRSNAPHVYSNESFIALYLKKTGKLEVYRAGDASRVGTFMLKEGTHVSDVCFMTLDSTSRKDDGSSVSPSSYAVVSCAHEYIVVLDLNAETEKLAVACQFDLSLAGKSDKKKRRHAWACSCVSPKGAFIFSGMTMHDDTQQYIVSWNRVASRAENVLKAPQGKPVSILCHPDPRPMQLFVLCDDGKVYVWCSIISQRWSIFQPEFETLECNREYQEAENEFDEDMDVELVGEEHNRAHQLLYDIDDDADATIDVT
ncbi:hypothetical protein M9435_003926 [Picochlorum sp. BPE23]|nr:hypothetical protein M9435_003926 [Picochlorum sp. BPE23]